MRDCEDVVNDQIGALLQLAGKTLIFFVLYCNLPLWFKNSKRAKSYSYDVFSSKTQLLEGEVIDEQVAAPGISPLSIDYMVLIYMDIDHNSELRLFIDTKGIWICE